MVEFSTVSTTIEAHIGDHIYRLVTDQNGDTRITRSPYRDGESPLWGHSVITQTLSKGDKFLPNTLAWNDYALMPLQDAKAFLDRVAVLTEHGSAALV